MKSASYIAAMMVAAGLSAGDALANAAEGILPAGSPLAHDQIALANETAFVEANFSNPLTTYAVGWMDSSDLMAELNYLFPPVQVTRRFEYASATNIEEFLQESADEDVREIHGEFKQVRPYTSSKVNAATLNKGLSIRIDLDHVADQANWREQHVARLTKRLLRAELRRGLALINAAAVNTGSIWSSSTDPDLLINAQITNASDISGVKPNRVYVGEDAWNLRWAAYRAQNNAGGYASAAMTEQQLASMLGLDRVFRSTSRYQNTGSAKAQFGGSRLFLFNAQDGQSAADPSNTKRFWSPCQDGTMIRVYERQVSAKIYEITVEHYSLPAITSTLGIRKLTVTAT